MRPMEYGVGLTISFRRGRPLAAYLTLPRREGDHVARSKSTPEGLVIDYAEDGREIGIEIPTPCGESMEALLAKMKELDLEDAESELRPMQRALAPA
ncbi:MAG TPA: DUF2283 domain-containing protein [Phycisphaerae bacterium]|nr:DUF2283 domain-containing protein [Phycisphaerae bacterium]